MEANELRTRDFTAGVVVEIQRDSFMFTMVRVV
jgi:hypothetical protein